MLISVLNKDGSVKDWDFFKQWLEIGNEEPKVKVYNKLVRDKIPEVIMKSGKSCIVRQVKDSEKFTLLMEKLKEEVQEFLEDENLEELADIMEVLVGLANSLGYSEKDLLKKRDEKREDRGGFQDGVVLERVYGENVGK